MSAFAPPMPCVHCEADITLPTRTVEGVEECWLAEDETFTCADCGGVNRVMMADDDAYFAGCEDEGCVACGLAMVGSVAAWEGVQ